MRRRQPLGDLRADVDDHPHRQRALADHRAQITALDVLHHDVGPVFAGADFVDRHDVRMVQRRRRPRLVREPRERVAIRREARGKHLDRHAAAELGIAGDVDLTHPSRADGTDDFVATERLPNCIH
jgi:hypothetical protein